MSEKGFERELREILIYHDCEMRIIRSVQDKDLAKSLFERTIASIRQIVRELVGEDKPLYGGQIEKALCLPPEDEWKNKGYNLRGKEILERVEG